MARTKRNVWAHALVFALSIGTYGLLQCGVAHAQGAVASNPEALGPPGIRVGNLEIHPEFSAKGGYDTNVYKADGEGDGPQSKIEGAGIITLTPGISLTTLGALRVTEGEDSGGPAAPPKLQLRAAGYASFFQYLGLTNPVTERDQNLRGAEFDVSGDFHIMPKRPVSLVLGASWTRNARPFTAPTGEQAGEGSSTEKKDERKSQAFNTIVPRARLMFESRGGVLTAFAGYRPTITPYEGVAFKYLSSAYHDADAGIGWRFFPSTSLLYDMTFTLVDYYKLDDVNPANVRVLLSNSKRVRARVGINGAFTRSLSLRVLGGYAVGVFDEEALDDYETPVGEAVLTYKFGSGIGSVAEAGYLRNVAPAAVGGFMLSDRGFARLKFVLLKMFAMTAEAGVSYVQYGRQLSAPTPAMGATPAMGPQPLGVDDNDADLLGEDVRKDIRVDTLLRAEYRVVSWLGFLADFVYQKNITDFEFGTVLTPDPAEYQTFQVSAGLRASY